jgi:hypothetical protein
MVDKLPYTSLNTLEAKNHYADWGQPPSVLVAKTGEHIFPNDFNMPWKFETIPALDQSCVVISYPSGEHIINTPETRNFDEFSFQNSNGLANIRQIDRSLNSFRQLIGFNTSELIESRRFETGNIYKILSQDTSKLEAPNRQSDLEETINSAQYIRDLGKDWDENNAQEIPLTIFESSISFLRQYNLFLQNNYGLSLPKLEINPCSNGSIDLSWRTENVRLLINIKEVNGISYAYFYGDRYNNKSPIKGNIAVDDFSEPLAIWMKSLTL